MGHSRSAHPAAPSPPRSGLTEAREILSSQRQPILDAVPEPDRPAAAAAIDALSSRLETVAAAAQAQDADVTAARLAVALDQLGKLELLQAPGLPFLIPAAYSDRPRLVGRAAAEVVFQRPGGAFSPLSDGKGAQPTAKVVVTLDGYNAPLTAGNAAALIDRAHRWPKAPPTFSIVNHLAAAAFSSSFP